MEGHARVWDEIDIEKKNPQPTPPIGLPVVWHHAGDKNKPTPARVYRYEDEPGRVALTVETPTGLQFRGGVYYAGSKHNNGSNRTIYNNGTWDYVQTEADGSAKIPAWHYDKHKAYIEKRMQAQRNSEAMQAATEAAMKAKREAAGV
jgi:hypothetical protein